MKRKSQWKTAVVLLTGISVVWPGSLMAEETRPERRSTQTVFRTRDVSLGTSGTLTGFLVGPQGQPEVATSVVIHRGKRRIAVVKTDARGRFEVTGLKGGVYQVSSPKGSALFRLWKDGTAPRMAAECAVVVIDAKVVRGQSPLRLFGSGGRLTTLGIGLGIAAAIAIPVAVHNSDNGDNSL